MKSVKIGFEKLHQLLLQEKPAKADAIVWLQGDRLDRARKVVTLYNKGYSNKIVITGNNTLIGVTKKTGENNISLNAMRDFLFKKGIEKKDLVVDDGAMNTKEQAEHILQIAINKKWSRLILVGSSYYQPRAFLTFLHQAKKAHWNGEIINQSVIIAWDKKPGGRDKTTKVIFDLEFEKLKKYKKDVVSIEQGIEYLNKKMFFLRKVTINDLKLLFHWANEPESRANATSTKLISLKEHTDWFSRKLADSSSYLYILTDSKKNIGIIRFEKSKNRFIISYSIDKKYRGKGFGSLLLKKGMDKMREMVGRPIFIGYIKKGNVASEKIFNHLNFVIKKEEIINNVTFAVYQK